MCERNQMPLHRIIVCGRAFSLFLVTLVLHRRVEVSFIIHDKKKRVLLRNSRQQLEFEIQIKNISDQKKRHYREYFGLCPYTWYNFDLSHWTWIEFYWNVIAFTMVKIALVHSRRRIYPSTSPNTGICDNYGICLWNVCDKTLYFIHNWQYLYF